MLSTDTVEFYLNKSFFDIDFIFLQAMKLKTLEIKGFKSFANQTIINFNEEVIGIVGPNGSGSGK